MERACAAAEINLLLAVPRRDKDHSRRWFEMRAAEVVKVRRHREKRAQRAH